MAHMSEAWELEKSDIKWPIYSLKRELVDLHNIFHLLFYSTLLYRE